MLTWCTPAMSSRFIDGVKPDALLALQLSTGSAVLCLEVDDGTEHAPIIRDKLERYAEALRDRPAWHLVLVVGWPESECRCRNHESRMSRAATTLSVRCVAFWPPRSVTRCHDPAPYNRRAGIISRSQRGAWWADSSGFAIS
jgi:protein involved in plasmid replication-relaxation